jgi:hypothetical protein
VQILRACPFRLIQGLTILGSILVLATLASCRTPQLVTVADSTGSYEFHSGNRALGTICFELDSNGSYHLGNARVSLSSISMRGAPETGRWTLSGGPGEEILLIGKASLPIERTPSSIRVTVDDDLGMYCDLPVHQP